MGTSINDNEETSLFYIFKTFLIIGATSFGGYSALIAVVQNKMVDGDKKISEDVIYNGFALASILPGPIAVNTVTYIGYHLRGWKGASIAMISVILPSFLLVVVFAHIYLSYGNLPQVRSIIDGIIPVIIAIVFSVVYSMTRKNVTNWKHVLILILGLTVQIFFSGYIIFILCILGSALVGVIIFKRLDNSEKNIGEPANDKGRLVGTSLFVVLSLMTFIVLATLFPNQLNFSLFRVFSKISLSMFGGGYVMIPILQNLIVDNLNWLSQQQFVDAIAIGQITPGPILISAAFIGYKVSGFIGAVIASIGIFGPSAILIILLAEKVKKFENNGYWRSMLEAIKPMVISFIMFSIWILMGSLNSYLMPSIIIIISAIALIGFKINYLYLILSFGFIGFLNF